MKRTWLIGLVLALTIGPSSVAWARPVSRYVVTMQSVGGATVVSFAEDNVTSVQVFVGCQHWSGRVATGTADVSGHNQLAIDVVIDGLYTDCSGQVSQFTGLALTLTGSPMGQTSRTRNADGSRTLVTSMSLTRSFEPVGTSVGTGQLTEVISQSAV